MIKYYGSQFCPNCKQFKYNLDKYNLDYEFIDISDNLKNLKDFLYIRDTNKKFDRMKEMNGIGIPCIIIDEKNVEIHWRNYLLDLGYKIYNLNDECEEDC
ncbi:MAG: hypothetical protein K6G28_05330 [Acholeplasmatales bacterium]|nr:hypothetical protein [Acholeplasmatales bacterium]